MASHSTRDDPRVGDGEPEYPTAVDLCAGCGGFSFGAQMVGFNVRAAFETHPAPRYTYQVGIADHDDMALYSHDVRDVDLSKIPDEDRERDDRIGSGIDAVFAGPPCQPFSEAGGSHYEGEPEDTIAFAIAEWIAALRPKVAAIENVGGLKNNHQHVLDAMLEEIRAAGYELGTVRLDAANYGVPQRRRRVFALAVREDLQPPAQWTPPVTHVEDPRQVRFGCDGDLDPFVTASNTLGDLPKPLTPQRPHTDGVHETSLFDTNRVTPHACGRWLSVDDQGRYYRADGPDGNQDVLVPPNHIETNHQKSTRVNMAEYPHGYVGSSTTDRRLHPDHPAPTVTVSEGTPPIHYVGRTPNNDEPIDRVRRLTVREAARLQTFPDHWCFAGTKFERFAQVGNAVPPALASHVADHLRDAIDE